MRNHSLHLLGTTSTTKRKVKIFIPDIPGKTRKRRRDDFYWSYIPHRVFHLNILKQRTQPECIIVLYVTERKQDIWKKHPKWQQAVDNFGEPLLCNTQSYNFSCNQLLAWQHSKKHSIFLQDFLLQVSSTVHTAFLLHFPSVVWYGGTFQWY